MKSTGWTGVRWSRRTLGSHWGHTCAGKSLSVAPDSRLEPAEPIAADFREGKDGRENGSLKIIAGLLDVGLDELVQREKQAERRRRLRANAVAAVMALLALGAAGAGSFAMLQRNEAVRQRGVAEENERHAQSALARMLVERSWSMTAAQRLLSARYALAGLDVSPSSATLARAALARLIDIDAPSFVAIEGSGIGVSAAAYDPSGARLVTVDEAGQFAVWDTTSGTIVWRSPPASSGEAVGFSPDGSHVFSIGSEGSVSIWDARRGLLISVLSGHADRVTAVSFSPDGRRLVTASFDRTVRLWDLTTGRLVATLQGHQSFVADAIFSSDGSKVLTASGDHTARVWDAETGAPLVILETDEGIFAAAFSPDGTRIATSSLSGGVAIWSASDGAQLHQLRHNLTVTALTFSADGLHLLGSDREGNFLQWSSNDGRLEHALDGTRYGLSNGLFRDDGELFVGDGSRGPAIVWEAASRNVIGSLSHEGLTGTVLGISPSGGTVALGLDDGRVLLWDYSNSLLTLDQLLQETCSRLARANGYRFSELEIASDPLIDEAWLRGNSAREVCADPTH